MTNEDTFHLGTKALIRNRDGRILVLTGAPGKVINKPHLDLPGGRLHRGENEIDALRREVKEECGIDTLQNVTYLMKSLSSLRIPVGDSDVGLIFSFYLCDVKEDQIITLSPEHLDYSWQPLDKFSDLIKSIYPSELPALIKANSRD